MSTREEQLHAQSLVFGAALQPRHLMGPEELRELIEVFDCRIKFTKTQPNVEGWWWVNIRGVPTVVLVLPKEEFGHRMCALVNDLWLPLDDYSGFFTEWAGPIRPESLPNAL